MFAGVSLFAIVIISRLSGALCSGAISVVLEIGHLCVHNQVFVACTGRGGGGQGPRDLLHGAPRTQLGLLSLAELNKVKTILKKSKKLLISLLLALLLHL